MKRSTSKLSSYPVSLIGDWLSTVTSDMSQHERGNTSPADYKILYSYIHWYSCHSADLSIFINIDFRSHHTPVPSGLKKRKRWTVDCKPFTDEKWLSTHLSGSTCVSFSLILGTIGFSVEWLPPLTVLMLGSYPKAEFTECFTRRCNYQNKEPERLNALSIDLTLCERTPRLLAPSSHESVSCFSLWSLMLTVGW